MNNWHGIGCLVESWFSSDRYGTFELTGALIGGEFCWTARFGSAEQATGPDLNRVVATAALNAGADPDVTEYLTTGMIRTATQTQDADELPDTTESAATTEAGAS